MALMRAAALKSAGEKMMSAFGPRRWAHAIAAQPPPLDSSMSHAAVTAPFVQPELDRGSVNSNSDVEYVFPSFASGGGSMELMAVPKKKVPIHVVYDIDYTVMLCGGKLRIGPTDIIRRNPLVSPHKRGIRNGPKALKPVPVIIRCKSCGRVKLPHFYCCSGDRGNNGEPNSLSS